VDRWKEKWRDLDGRWGCLSLRLLSVWVLVRKDFDGRQSPQRIVNEW